MKSGLLGGNKSNMGPLVISFRSFQFLSGRGGGGGQQHDESSPGSFFHPSMTEDPWAEFSTEASPMSESLIPQVGDSKFKLFVSWLMTGFGWKCQIPKKTCSKLCGSNGSHSNTAVSCILLGLTS